MKHNLQDAPEAPGVDALTRELPPLSGDREVLAMSVPLRDGLLEDVRSGALASEPA
ncbi:MAG: hypothetical protein AVDCRST_MAG53-3124 [uncultured Solirubrobacteraceae bacterium]|uniref:Uncharacterized protein n=1 Tax=uncultured Solirubrobacteraceae bacterium TaxID=1162706 RepID=A0A6J4T8L9_9ACTN|nr:MAG: hypothetical protein AVDCRST_MAG53-3124 [uncultured Solirubrobacteraceae bacterium]